MIPMYRGKLFKGISISLCNVLSFLIFIPDGFIPTSSTKAWSLEAYVCGSPGSIDFRSRRMPSSPGLQERERAGNDPESIQSNRRPTKHVKFTGKRNATVEGSPKVLFHVRRKGEGIQDQRVHKLKGEAADLKLGSLHRTDESNKPAIHDVSSDMQESGFSRSMASLVNGEGGNPFQKALKFECRDGLGLALKVYIPFGETVKDRHNPLKVIVARHARVFESIELLLAKYTEERRSPSVIPKSEAYELRMEDMDCLPDMDLPAFDKQDPMAKYRFESYCLCQVRNFDSYLAKSEEPELEPVPKYKCKVHTSDGATILNPSDRDTVNDIIMQTVAKRSMRPRALYSLEKLKFPGMHLNGDTPFIELEEQDFKLTRKFCKLSFFNFFFVY
eukprot:m.257427 g.257427  ORF g.257427 m.257427 type:complete len:388 (+) comp16189_c0_seq33:178-1341(+)